MPLNLLDKKDIGEHELKFSLPNFLAPSFWSWLSTRCQADPKYHEGIVSSIYFDTREFNFLSEKQNSTYLKTKIRLRWYSSAIDNSPFPLTFLEVKNKIGSTRLKKRFELSFDSSSVLSKSLDNHFFLTINSVLNENGIVLRKPVFPAFQIDYRRSRFIDPHSGARLSLDRNINVPRVNWTMIKKRNGLNLKAAVFECKHKAESLPEWLYQVSALSGCRKEAFSKYLKCYEKLQNHSN